MSEPWPAVGTRPGTERGGLLCAAGDAGVEATAAVVVSGNQGQRPTFERLLNVVTKSVRAAIRNARLGVRPNAASSVLDTPEGTGDFAVEVIRGAASIRAEWSQIRAR